MARIQRPEETCCHSDFSERSSANADVKKLQGADSDNIKPIHRDGIWHRKMHNANNEKQQMTHDRSKRTTKPRKNQKAWRKGNLQILGNIRSRQVEMKEKI